MKYYKDSSVIIFKNKQEEISWIILYFIKRRIHWQTCEKNAIFYATSIISFSQACHYIL